MKYTVKKLETVEEMLFTLGLVMELTPDLDQAHYEIMLREMVPHNYRQVAVYDENKLIGVSGYWIATKIYSGRYLEIDNFVITKEYRSRNIGKLMIDWMLNEARESNCKTMMLDAYVENFKAHKFYYREGFIARGFHYLKKL